MAESGGSVVQLNEYAGVLKRGARLIGGVVLAGAVVGTLLLVVQPRSYVAEARVQVRPIVADSDDPNLDLGRQIDMDTEGVIARSQRVAERALALRGAADELGVDDLAATEVAASADGLEADQGAVRAAMAQTSVETVRDSTVLAFTAEAASASRAQAVAQSTAVAYLAFRSEQALSAGESSRARLARREAALIDELRLLRTEAPGVLAYAEISKKQELTVIGSTFANLEGLSVDPGVVISDAALPSAPEGTPLIAGPIMGGLLGLVVALGGVFLLDRTDDRLRRGRQELSALGVPLLGEAPVGRIQPGATGGSPSKIFPVNTTGGDAYRRLQGTVLFNLDRENRSLILVAGVTSTQAATSVAANLAVNAARAGRRTLVVGADMRNAQLGRHLGLPAVSSGLSDVILDGALLSEAIQGVDGFDDLDLLGSGTNVDQPTDVLQNEAFGRLMSAVQADFDLVVVEAPPIMKVADAVDAAGFCDGVVLVAEQGRDSRQAIADSVDQLRAVGSEVVGIVVTDDA
ncbi:MAG: polysaccharide biosynthesis tyrosine autokinase [Actinomycetota bacterium]